MDRQYIQDQQVIERYLNGQLSAEEEQAFEEYFMADHEVLEELQIAERLRQGLQALNDAGELERRGGRGGWQNFLSSPLYAAAASIVAAAAIVFSGVMYTQNLNLRGGPLLADSPVTTRLVPLISVRGSSDNEISIANADEWTVLLVDVGFEPYDSYSATVSRTDGPDARELWQLGDLPPTYDGQVAVGMPGRLLVPGEYEIRIEGRMNDWPSDRESAQVSQMPVTVSPPQP